MELKEPKRKRRVKPPQQSFLPVPLESETGIPVHRAYWKKYTGIFFGDSVAIYNPDHMTELYKNGFFGKGSLSRSEPCFERMAHGIPPVIRERQWLRRCDWEKKVGDSQSTSDFLTQMSLLSNLPENNRKDSSSLVSGNTRNLHNKKNDKIVEVVQLDSDNSTSDKEDSKESTKSCKETSTKSLETTQQVTNKTTDEHDLVTLDSPNALTADPEEGAEVLDKERETKRYIESSTKSLETTQQVTNKTTDEHDLVSPNALTTDPDECAEVLDKERETVQDELSDIRVSNDKKSEDKSENRIVDVEVSKNDLDKEDSMDKCTAGNSNKQQCQQSMNEVTNITSVEQENVCDKQASATNMLTGLSSTDNDKAQDCSIQEKDGYTNKDGDVVYKENLCSQTEFTEVKDVSEGELCITNSMPPRINCFKKALIIVADSDSEDEDNYFNRLNPRLEIKKHQIQESLNLTLEEAFFLSYGLGCLEILGLLGNPLSLKNAWKSFVLSKPDFIQSYISYHHFRSKGWVVKPGLKFGGDFLLYKDGPPFYHASYIVMIDVLNEKNGCRIKGMSREPLTSFDIVNLNRLAETSGKEILFCYVLWPEDLHDKSLVTPKMFNRFKVSEVLLRRWKSSEEREQLEQEEIV